MGNVEQFELFEADPKTQCKERLLYWSQGIVYCTCGHLLKETVANRSFIVYTFGPSFNSRIRNQQGKTSWPQIWETSTKQRISSIKPIIWKRDAKRGTTKESMIGSCEIMFSVNEWFNTIEMKKFVVHGMFLQNKITPIICQKKNTSTTGKIGGSLSIIILEKPDRWEIVLISTMRWPHYTIYTKNLENDNSGQCHSGSINTGTNHRVLPPVGGNGAIPGGAHDNSKKSTNQLTCISTW